MLKFNMRIQASMIDLETENHTEGEIAFEMYCVNKALSEEDLAKFFSELAPFGGVFPFTYDTDINKQLAGVVQRVNTALINCNLAPAEGGVGLDNGGAFVLGCTWFPAEWQGNSVEYLTTQVET